MKRGTDCSKLFALLISLKHIKIQNTDVMLTGNKQKSFTWNRFPPRIVSSTFCLIISNCNSLWVLFQRPLFLFSITWKFLQEMFSQSFHFTQHEVNIFFSWCYIWDNTSKEVWQFCKRFVAHHQCSVVHHDAFSFAVTLKIYKKIIYDKKRRDNCKSG